MQLVSSRPVKTVLEINGEEVDAIDTVTMFGLETIASCLGSPFNFVKAWMPYIAMGRGATEPSTEDKFLEYEMYREEGIVTVNTPGTAYRVQNTFKDITADFYLREVGMIEKSAGGRMAARWSLVQDLLIEIGDWVDITCWIYIE